jgi:DNA-binding transcriptional MocR family regulator
MAVWIDTRRDATLIQARARDVGVGATSEAECAIGQGLPGTHLRLSFAKFDEAEMAQALDLLMKVIRATPLKVPA